MFNRKDPDAEEFSTLPFDLRIDWNEAVPPIVPQMTFPLNHGQSIPDDHFHLTSRLTPYRLLLDFSEADTSDKYVLVSTAEFDERGSVSQHKVDKMQVDARGPYLLEQYFISITRPDPKFPDCILINGPESVQNLGPMRLMIYEPIEGPWIASVYLTQLEGRSKLIRWAVI